MPEKLKSLVLNKTRNIKSRMYFTPARVAVLGMLLSLMVVLKYTFGFIPGVEMISFMFIFLGIFLPIIDLVLLIVSFNFLMIVIYGFGSWWMMYWIIWPIDAFVSKGLSKITKNRFAFGIWGFFAGFLVFFWYFISDLIFFGQEFAILNIISAIPINLIEGLTTLVSFILIAPILSKVFKQYSTKFWNKKIEWDFKEIKHKKINISITIIIVLFCLSGIIVLFTYNDIFLELKQFFIKANLNDGKVGDGKIKVFPPTK